MLVIHTVFDCRHVPLQGPCWKRLGKIGLEVVTDSTVRVPNKDHHYEELMNMVGQEIAEGESEERARQEDFGESTASCV